jgi:putative CocE/NonD family hydrolase
MNDVLSPSAADVHMQWGVRIPLRDGFHLNATLYTPKSRSAPAPYVLTMSPYIADTYHERGMYFASHGMPFAAVDVRGRGNSTGTFNPFIQEAQDAYDVIEWLARQPCCNGKVAMRGGSYCGYVQWAAAKEFPPHLATIVPTAAPYIGVDFPMRSNIFFPYILQWLNFTAGHTGQGQIFADRALWSGIYRQWHESGRSFRKFDAMLGSPAALFQEWLDHPEPDDYWDTYNPTTQQYAGIEIPILTITGSYDDDQPGALEHYKNHLSHASAEARARHYLVIGPWDHIRTGKACAEFGGLRFGPESLVDIHELHRQWYAWTLQNGARPKLLEKRVAYYVMGAERWRHAETLEEITARHQPYFLDSTGLASDVFCSGSLQERPGTGRPDSYIYDPRDTSGPEIEAEANTAGDSLVDQRVTLALRGKQLVYHSAPFEEDTEIGGFFKLVAWIAIDCPDTDLYVSVHEIGLDGSSIRLSTDGIRARYREDSRVPKLIETHEPLRYELERFTFVSRQIKRGHRLRLIMAPMGRLLETTFAEKNYNGGGIVAEESVAEAKPVTVRLYHDAAHPTALYVPLAREDSDDANA